MLLSESLRNSGRQHTKESGLEWTPQSATWSLQVSTGRLNCAAFARHCFALGGGSNCPSQYLCGDHDAVGTRLAVCVRLCLSSRVESAEFAAEFLRLNPAYRRDHRAAVNRLSHGQSTTLLNRWDLKFPFRPRRGCEIDQIGACRCEHLRFGCRTLLLRSFFSRLPPRNSVKRAASRPVPGRCKRRRVSRP